MQRDRMSGLTLIPPQGRKHNRTAILDATRFLLRAKGPETLTMDEIAREARLARRTIYNHFADMQELFEQSHRALIGQLAPLVPAAIAAQTPPHQALTRFVHQAIRLFDDPCHIDIQISLVRDRDTQQWIAAAYDTQISAPMVERLAAFLEHIDGRADATEWARDKAQQLVTLLQALSLSRHVFERRGSEMALPVSSIVASLLEQVEPQASEAA